MTALPFYRWGTVFLDTVSRCSLLGTLNATTRTDRSSNKERERDARERGKYDSTQGVGRKSSGGCNPHRVPSSTAFNTVLPYCAGNIKSGPRRSQSYRLFHQGPQNYPLNGCFGQTSMEKRSTQYAKGGGFPSVYLTYLYCLIIVNHKLLCTDGIKNRLAKQHFLENLKDLRDLQDSEETLQGGYMGGNMG